MLFRLHHAVLLGGSAIAGLGLFGNPAVAQTELPAVTVTAPSPIVRRKPVVAAPRHVHVTRASPVRNAAPVPVEAEPVAVTTQGELPIVTDQFATVTVIPNEEIRRSGANTLGDLVANKPGITASSFAPGAASRRSASRSRGGNR